MDIISLLILFGILAFFAFIIYMMITASRANREKKRQLAQALGLTPIEPDERLSAKINFSPINTQLKKPDQNMLSEPVNQALDIFRLLSK
jgi:hypothetical protein